MMPPYFTLSIIRYGIKSKVEQSRERSSAPRLHLSVVAIEKGTFGSPTLLTFFTSLILFFLASHLDYEPVTGLSPGWKCPGYDRKHEPPAL